MQASCTSLLVAIPGACFWLHGMTAGGSYKHSVSFFEEEERIRAMLET